MSNCDCDRCVLLKAERRIGRQIVTEHVYPPIPVRAYDWSAVTVDYEPGQPMGWGPTKRAAIAHLIEQQEEHEPNRNSRYSLRHEGERNGTQDH
jgi:hypothetical protein